MFKDLLLKLLQNRIVQLVLVGVSLLVVGFFAGKYSTPEKVVEKVRIEKVEVEKQVVVAQEKVRIEKVYIKDYTKHVHREETEVMHPDGLVEKKKTEDENVEKVVKENAIQYIDREVVKYVDRKVVDEEEVEKRVENKRASWRVNALVGTEVTHLHLEATAPYVSPIVFGGQVERRVIGPIWVNGYGLSNGTVGLGLGMEW